MHRDAIISTLGRLADGPSFRLRPFRIFKTFGNMMRVAQERRDLAALEDRMLRDIGLDRRVAHRESERLWFDLPRNRFGGFDR